MTDAMRRGAIRSLYAVSADLAFINRITRVAATPPTGTGW